MCACTHLSAVIYTELRKIQRIIYLSTHLVRKAEVPICYSVLQGEEPKGTETMAIQVKLHRT
jgi:hypothetical protein